MVITVGAVPHALAALRPALALFARMDASVARKREAAIVETTALAARSKEHRVTRNPYEIMHLMKLQHFS